MIGDFAIKPIAPPLDLDEETAERVVDQETQAKADLILDPKWGAVEGILLANIEQFSHKPNPQLPAEEYKIKSLADEQAKAALLSVLQEIQDAVTATEGQRTGDS